MSAYTNIISQIAWTLSRWRIKVLLKPLMKFAQLFVAIMSLLTNKSDYYPKQAVINGCEIFDYVIVGGGTAGCVLANRLTENSNTTVLLIESGDIPSFASDFPGLFPLIDYSAEEWGFYSTDDGYSSQAMKNNNVHMTAGKMLGGSSGVSYLLYVRGDNASYDKWADMGNEGWDWESVLPYFKKSEDIDSVEVYRSNTSDMHGINGPMHVKKPVWKGSTELYLKGFAQNGRDVINDTNGSPNSLGYSESELSTDDHYRQSTAISYLKTIKNRKNLSVLRNSMVTKIIFNDNKEAIGVEVVVYNEKTVVIYAKKEVIVCAGAINSPKLLMLSGVGPKKHLEEKGIKLIVDSPYVGQNFTDTPLILFALTGKKGFLQSFGDNMETLLTLNSFPSSLLLGHGRLNKTVNTPQYQINGLSLAAGSLIGSIFCSSIFRYDDELCIEFDKENLLVEMSFGAHSLSKPESTGSVTLKCADYNEPPIIRTGYYSKPIDLKRHAQYLLDFFTVVDTPVFKSFGSKVVNFNIKQCKHLKINTLAYWKCYILNLAGPQWNFSGTCSMGPEGVVDEKLRVRGVKRVRVVDASVIPAPVPGNYVPVVVMIAEKAADMIKEDPDYYCA